MLDALSPGALLLWGVSLLVLSLWLNGKYDDSDD
jgi:hypothetical protein